MKQQGSRDLKEGVKEVTHMSRAHVLTTKSEVRNSTNVVSKHLYILFQLKECYLELSTLFLRRCSRLFLVQ